MKKIVIAVMMATLGSALSACSYGGVATSGDKAVVLRNDMLLFGALRKVFVCKMDAGGLSNCNSSVAP